MKKLGKAVLVLLSSLILAVPAYAGGHHRSYNGYCNHYSYYNHYRRYHHHYRGFNRRFVRNLGVIVAGTAAVAVLDSMLSPRTVIVRPIRSHSSCYRNAYNRAYDEETERLRRQRFYRWQRLQQERGRNDARRDFYYDR